MPQSKKQQKDVAENVSDATFASAPSTIREAKDDEKPDPSSIQHVEELDESDPRVSE